MIVRARLKPIADIPARAICCAKVRELMTAAPQVWDECFVDTSQPTMYDATCHFCGTYFPPEPGYRIAGEPGEVIISLWEFDEGETSPGRVSIRGFCIIVQ